MPPPKRSTIAESFARWGDADAHLLMEITDYIEQVREMLAESEAMLAPSRAGSKHSGESMPYTVIWYGRQGLVDKMTFDAEKAAKDHAMSMFATRKGDDGVISVEVRKDNGAVVFSHAEN
ncbi:MAG: hypothetical protein EOQ28_13620 [Mesorhizobium sp.]|uniref:hypothetical protein n=1 Tax=Mesorhizobium sp. TaxID=1871066 RepID=UPI000FE40573|nr:hypothetical protein [Mesorhizobium sp.]RWA74034.1 MAG: hypothetical protein EOQ28_13620 [Mesorhizobium sp.]RWC05164.1 MAG: hypothetical protein EOQ57_01960 [Mesorhizobium sp.]RWK09667.1 MAG: hypothetical protein EOR42_02935 [Mesorhizobium sp.]RWK13263.1 MAG: hypothetical protein EOR39_01495 [Mesorhizobium sp.]TIQ45053.1 MAG: hypothetical protein E5X47_27530 [Mesorhizobium sp.]